MINPILNPGLKRHGDKSATFAAELTRVRDGQKETEIKMDGHYFNKITMDERRLSMINIIKRKHA